MDIPYTVEIRKDTGLYNAKIGIWLFLASEVMLFGALFSSYILLRVGTPEGYWPHGWLNIPLGTANTIVLITSSITTVMAWASLKMKNFGRFKLFHAITLCCALIFLCIKSYEYHDKFTHYRIMLANGHTADGHIVEESKDFDLTKKTGSITINFH
jgi:cytochrome c oxidase subunit 3